MHCLVFVFLLRAEEVGLPFVRCGGGKTGKTMTTRLNTIRRLSGLQHNLPVLRYHCADQAHSKQSWSPISVRREEVKKSSSRNIITRKLSRPRRRNHDARRRRNDGDDPHRRHPRSDFHAGANPRRPSPTRRDRDCGRVRRDHDVDDAHPPMQTTHSRFQIDWSDCPRAAGGRNPHRRKIRSLPQTTTVLPLVSHPCARKDRCLCTLFCTRYSKSMQPQQRRPGRRR